ncbi:hypothetical protein BN59_03220 [Legionella massiliensis]|uniref:Ycf48-like protein n=1 Tax=Legionella massiliensis TaxID=1034943 RepID=A0A078KWS2_9GAMM|nr:sialidase family protein [Legionella massiliensis]CDZ78905.1 hypothetical protein BN59_03220 [Legionella massiliensis]CEE14643.1 hypothetical protein BN1094_03220 [Legionella massiliensis]
MKKTLCLTLLSTACLSAPSFAATLSTHQLNTTLKRLETVSCDKTGIQCIAIGFGAEFHLQDRLVATSQDGGLTWSEPTLLASPKEEVTPLLNDTPNSASISCDEFGQQCIVASSAVIEGVPTPLVYTTHDGGLSWSAPKLLPLPKDVNKTQIYANNSLVTSISCDQTGTVCTIAGGLAGDNEAIPLIYSTTNAGDSWKFSSLKQPSYQAPSSGYHGTVLLGVSCNFSGLNCVAVGHSVVSTSFFSDYYSSHPVSYSTQDGGAHWSNPYVLDTKETNNQVSTLVDIACDSSGIQCTAIGYFNYSSQSLPFSITTRNNGASWTPMNYIIPKAGFYDISAMHCDSSGKYCVAVGGEFKYIDTVAVVKPLIYTTENAGSVWEKSADRPFPNSSVLNDVFCSNTGAQCVAVGAKASSNALALRRFSFDKHHLFKSEH